MMMYSCASNGKSSYVNYVINLDSLPHIDNINMSSIYKNDVKVILLDTIQDALLGNINKIRVCTNGDFIVFDKLIGKKINMFDSNGKFIRQIGRLGDGPGEYFYIDDFAYSPQSNDIYILDSSKKKIFIYNVYTGNFIGDLDCPIDSRNIYYSNGLIFLDNKLKDWDSESSPMVVSINPLTKEETLYYMDKYSYGISKIKTYPCPDGFFMNNNVEGMMRYNYSFSNILFTRTENCLIPWVTFISSEWIKDEDIEKLDYSNPLFVIDLLKLDKYHAIHNFVESDNYMYCAVTKGTRDCYVYVNIKTDETFLVSHIQEDILFKNVPFNKLNYNLGCSYEQGTYYYLNIDEIILEVLGQYKERLTQEGVSKMKSLFNNISNYNGAIVYYEYK